MTLTEFRFRKFASANAKRQLRRDRSVRKSGREADWQAQKERKTVDERPRTEKNACAEPVNDEKSSSPSRRRVEACARRTPSEDVSKKAAVCSGRSRENATLSASNVCATERSVVEESSAVEGLAKAGALDGDASNSTVALVQKDATIKTKNVQPKEFLSSKRGFKAE